MAGGRADCLPDRGKYVTAGTIAKDVNITDIGLPQGLILADGAQSVEVLAFSSR